jgi:cellulose synthase/poly-beta-1,6-N-acetylglucosamine synthase-like glycosyltransferase
VIHSPTAGSTTARNIGVTAATQDVIVFTDDDVLVEPTWLETLVGALTEAGPKTAVTGQVLPGDEEVAGGRPMSVHVDPNPASYAGRVGREVLSGNNFAVYRSALAEVGGNLVGNAKWTGVRLRDVLAIAGVQPAATQLVGRSSASDFSAGMPTAWVMDPSREPMIAVKMNDAPLPPSHGYPARLIIPGLYGYVSATKWLTDLELTTLEAFDGYWIRLGWAKDGPILTQSRIDTPRGGVSAGQVAIAGIAWAPDRGVSRVEVSIDGVWRDAKLSMPISDATWVQWVVQWATTPGDHVIQVRATDGKGSVQPEQPSPPAPDGARGWHTINVHAG